MTASWVAYLLVVVHLIVEVFSKPDKSGAYSLPDCKGVIGFSSVGALKVQDSGILSFKSTLFNYENSWTNEVGVFTCQCLGIYHVTFTVQCESNCKVVLKKRDVKKSSWSPIVATTSSGGSNAVLCHLGIGEQLALFVEGNPRAIKSETNVNEPHTSFSGFKLNG